MSDAEAHRRRRSSCSGRVSRVEPGGRSATTASSSRSSRCSSRSRCRATCSSRGRNMMNIALTRPRRSGIIACGGTLVIIAGGFDLSVGAVVGFAAIVAGEVVRHTGVGLVGRADPRGARRPRLRHRQRAADHDRRASTRSSATLATSIIVYAASRRSSPAAASSPSPTERSRRSGWARRAGSK